MNELALINPEFLKFSEDIQQRIYERIKKGDRYFFLMRKEEIEKELEEEEREKITKPADHNIDTPHIHKGSNQLITLETLFDSQVSTLIQKGFPILAGMNEVAFLSYISPLKEHLKDIESMEFNKGHIPFVIVIKSEIIAPEKVMPLVELEGTKGISYFNTETIKKFKPIEGLNIPNEHAYLAIDIETGKTTLGKTPNEAIIQTKSENRSPLTLEEGVALVIYYPEILKDNLIWLLGSRRSEDLVANLWIREGRPRLDSFWSNFSNSEWGSASCLRRI